MGNRDYFLQFNLLYRKFMDFHTGIVVWKFHNYFFGFKFCQIMSHSKIYHNSIIYQLNQLIHYLSTQSTNPLSINSIN